MVSTNACMVVDLFHVRNIKTELLQKKLFELSVQQKMGLQIDNSNHLLFLLLLSMLLIRYK